MKYLSTQQKQQEEKRRLMLIKSRLEGLIHSSVDNKITLAQGKDWSYDTKHKKIIYPVDGPVGVKNLPGTVFIGNLLHEVAHAKYSSRVGNLISKLPKEYQKEYALLLNCLEDIRVERKITDRFPGSHDNLSDATLYLEPYYTEEEVRSRPDHENLMINIIRGDKDLPQYFTKEAEKFIKQYEDTIQEVLEAETSLTLHNAIKKKLWPAFLKLLPPPEADNKPDNDGEGDGKGDGEKGGDTPPDDGDNNQNQGGDDEQQAPLGMDDLNKQVMPKDGSSNAQDFGGSLMDDTKKEPEKLEDSQELTKRPLGDPDNYGRTLPDHYTYEELYKHVKPYIKYFTSKLDSILVDNNLQRFGGAYKSGKLNTKSLYKYKCNNTKLFTRKILRQHKDYSVCLLVDTSSSMGGSNIYETLKATVLLSEVLNKIGIPFEISAFNSHVKLYKKYDAPFNWSAKRQIEQSALDVDGVTSDAFGIIWADHRLQQRSGEKIMLVLSDGGPNADIDKIPKEDMLRLPAKFQSYDDFDLKTEIRKASRNSVVVGIGLGYGEQVERYYPQRAVCGDVTKLSKILLGVLQKQIKRG